MICDAGNFELDRFRRELVLFYKYSLYYVYLLDVNRNNVIGSCIKFGFNKSNGIKNIEILFNKICKLLIRYNKKLNIHNVLDCEYKEAFYIYFTKKPVKTEDILVILRKDKKNIYKL